MKMIIYTPGHLFYVNCNSDTELCPNKIGKIGRLSSHTFTDNDNDDDNGDDDNLYLYTTRENFNGIRGPFRLYMTFMCYWIIVL
jgi:hypothetical protein